MISCVVFIGLSMSAIVIAANRITYEESHRLLPNQPITLQNISSPTDYLTYNFVYARNESYMPRIIAATENLSTGEGGLVQGSPNMLQNSDATTILCSLFPPLASLGFLISQPCAFLSWAVPLRLASGCAYSSGRSVVWLLAFHHTSWF